MKKTLLTLALVAATAAAFAQGKDKVQNDGASPITLADSNHVLPADVGVAGLAVVTSGPSLPSGIRLDGALYWGTSSSSLALAVNGAGPGVNPSVLNPASGGSGVAGVLNPQSIQVTGNGGGTPVFVQLKVWDAAYATYDLAFAAGSYTGQNNIFQMTFGTSIAYNSTLNGGGSTWTAAGNASPLVVGVPGSVTPEPGTMALAGLGAAAMMVFRRRNK